MVEQEPVSVDIQVKRYPKLCGVCPVANKTALDFAAGNPAIRAMVVNDCAIIDVDAGVKIQLAGLEFISGSNDLFHLDHGSVSVPVCPGRLIQAIDKAGKVTPKTRSLLVGLLNSFK